MKNIKEFLQAKYGALAGILIGGALVTLGIVLGASSSETISVNHLIDGVEYVNDSVRVHANDGHPWWFLLSALGVVIFVVTASYSD